MKEKLSENEEEILQKLIEISSIPSNSGDEIIKGRYMQKLFYEYGIKNVQIDPFGNVVGEIKGESDEKLVVFADLDSNLLPSKLRVTMRDISGSGVGTSSYPLFVLAQIGKMIAAEGSLKKTLLLVCFSEGKRNHTGIKFFLDNNIEKIKGMIYLKGLEEGRLEKSTSAYTSVNIFFREKDFERIREDNKNRVFYSISKLLGKIKEEDVVEMFNLRIEDIEKIRKESEKYMVKIGISSPNSEGIEEGLKIIKEIVEGIRAEEGIAVDLHQEFYSNGSYSSMEQLYNIFADQLKENEQKVYCVYESSEIAVPLNKNIDTICFGIGRGGNLNQENEYLEIKSIYKGLEMVYKGILQFDKED